MGFDLLFYRIIELNTCEIYEFLLLCLILFRFTKHGSVNLKYIDIHWGICASVSQYKFSFIWNYLNKKIGNSIYFPKEKHL